MTQQRLFRATGARSRALPNLPQEALQLLKRNHLAVLLLGAGLVLAWERSPREPADAG